MPPSPHQTVFNILTALSVALSAGAVDAAEELLDLPEPLVTDVIDDAVDGPGAAEQKASMLAVLAQDPRPGVRLRVAEKVEALWDGAPREAQSLLHRLANDTDASVREAAGSALAELLTHASPLYRLAVAAEWAGSSLVREREALAAALTGPVPPFVTDVLIERLAADPSPAVRARVVQAAGRRFHENPAVYGRVARTLAGDSHRPIRHAARRLLRRLG